MREQEEASEVDNECLQPEGLTTRNSHLIIQTRTLEACTFSPLFAHLLLLCPVRVKVYSQDNYGYKIGATCG